MFNFIFICTMRISEVVNLVVYVMNGEQYSWRMYSLLPCWKVGASGGSNLQKIILNC